MTANQIHEKFMAMAIELAKKGFVSPNPRVGAVITENNKIIAEGYHEQFGGTHAEINALDNVPLNLSLTNATLYVSLEPCSHYGKTPPCVDTIIKRGIKTVVIACLDPNPLVSGKGVTKLKEAGISVTVGVLEAEAKILNESFFKYITTGYPYVLLKGASTLDGKIATSTGKSRWISSEESRLEVHYLRSQLTAIMVGVNTVIADDPSLDSRIENGRNPIRIILDNKLRTPITSKVVRTAKSIKTYIATLNQNKESHIPYLDCGINIIVSNELEGNIDLQSLMGTLGKENIDSILLEGGADIFYSALKSKIVDKVQIYYAPKIFGGTKAKGLIGGEGIDDISDAITLKSYIIRQIGIDFVIEGYISEESKCSQVL